MIREAGNLPVFLGFWGEKQRLAAAVLYLPTAGKSKDALVSFTRLAEVTTDNNGLVGLGVDTVLVDVTDVDLDSGVVLSSDDTTSEGTLARSISHS